MLVFGLTLAIFVLAALGLALGLVVQGKRLSGSCGGKEGLECLCKAKGIVPGGTCPKRSPAIR